MSLSKLNLELSVEQITDKYIESSNYSTLRDSCIILSPIPFVTSEIKALLSHILQIDQKESTSDLTLDACKKQSQYDLDEQRRDHQESDDDSLLAVNLEFQLQLLREKTRSAEAEKRQYQENIRLLQVRIKHLDELILAAHKKDEETHQHHSHSEPADTPSKATHNYPHLETIEQHDHTTHTHPEVSPHLNTTDRDSNTTLHGHAGADLVREKDTLIKELNSLQIGLKSEQLCHQKLIESHNKISKKFLDLPEKAKQRQIRAEARTTRVIARLGDDPTLLQLSEENRHSLNKSVETAHKKLHQKQEQLMQRAIEISYQTYLTRLEIYLQSATNRSYQENEALKQIIQFIREYLTLKAEEQRVRLVRNAVFFEKEEIVRDKSQNEKKVERFKQSIPQLAFKNVSLGKENEQLEIAIKERHNYRNTLLKIGLLFFFLAAGGAGAAAVVTGEIFAITSLFMAPAALLAVVTLSLFIAALIYTIKNSMDRNQLSTNQTIIRDNIVTIAQQDSEIISLEKEILPELAHKISGAEGNLSRLDKHIDGLFQHAELKLNNAKKVTVQYPVSQPFFTSDQTSQYSYQDSSASAAFMHESLEESTFTPN
ncbi:hypothetical protein [Legionella parisiensis]|uniref:LegC3 N-terminal Legionellaceae domain-containing protein n=1 Tax=Legionella parisiensis TaxID=45071 RepID=A0A1E5JUW7_9GAMM|nr:hypothetical protein [Legionella parisiensis]KTD41123.1 substrate of the Dot/Icm secretion system [Legionella parisiensis]OEH48336.1 hypothetical protein lpari_00592 [Legionella parisiensis]STX76579.1 substrate of the Dot/Icm secretion system [Legionella parisiensis]